MSKHRSALFVTSQADSWRGRSRHRTGRNTERLIEEHRKHHNGNTSHMVGYVELDLGAFDPYAPFTVACWVASGEIPCNAAVWSIEMYVAVYQQDRS
jgi:hypothetical protein